MVLTSDHISPATGLSPTVTLSKNGGSFASPSGAVTEIANGWYKVAGNATDNGTLGPLILHATGTAADPVDVRYQVVAFDPEDAVRFGLTALPPAAAAASGGLPTVDASNAVKVQSGTGANQISLSSGLVTLAGVTHTGAVIPTVTTTTTATNVTTVNGLAAGVITAASIAADAITDAKVASDVTIASVTGAVGSVTGAVGSVTGNVGGNVVGTSGLTAAAVDLIWDELRIGHLVAGSEGEALAILMSMIEVDGLEYRYVANALEQAPTGGTAPTAAAIADAVWDEVQTGHTTAGTFGKYLDAAVSGVSTGGVSASDIATAVWTDLLAGADFSTSASIGKLLKDDIDAAISSRSTFAGGAVASVTGNVGGNVNGNVVGSVGSVTGAVGSVTGAVGSVTGNVGGNVVGSTASVAGAVGSVAGAVGSVAGDVGGRVLGGGSGTITGDGVRASSVTGAVGSVTAGVSLSAAAVDLIWDEAQSGHATAGTFGKYLDTEVGAIKAVTDKLNTALELDGSVYRYTINALEQAPAGGGGGTSDWTSDERDQIRHRLAIDGTSAEPVTTLDIPEVNVIQHLGVDCPTTPIAGAPLVALSDGTGAGQVNLDAGTIVQVANVAVTATLTDRTDFALGADGLDAVDMTAPSGVASNFREAMVSVYRRFFGKTTKSSSQIKTFADNGTSVLTTQAISVVGNDETQGSAT